MAFSRSLLSGVAALSLAGMLGCEDVDVDADDRAHVSPVSRAAFQGSPADPNPVVFAEVRANGTGCPPGTAHTRISDDGLVFTTTFSNYVAEVNPSSDFAVRECQLAIRLKTPNDRTSFSVQTFSYSGFALLQEGIIGRQTASYSFQGAPVTPVESDTTALKGPHEAEYLFKQEVPIEDRVWSECDLVRDLNVVTRLQLFNSAPRRMGYMNLSSVDGSQRLVLTLSRRSCDVAASTTHPTSEAPTDKPTGVRVVPGSVAVGEPFVIRWLPPESTDASTVYRVQIRDAIGPVWESPPTRLLTLSYAGEPLPSGLHQVVVVARTADRTGTSAPVPLEIRAAGPTPPRTPTSAPGSRPPQGGGAPQAPDASGEGSAPGRGTQPSEPDDVERPGTSGPATVPPLQTNDQLSRRCSAGDLQACFDLAARYDLGQGAVQDFKRAFPLFKRACDGGHALSCNAVGDYYYFGKGMARNYTLAPAMYSKSCDGGVMTACTNLGFMYIHGQGVAQNFERAAVLSKRACDGDDANGCNNLGLLYWEGKGVRQDWTLAAALFSRGCDRGLPSACSNLGYAHQTGQGVPPDAARAAALYSQACDGGYAQGCANLAESYELGRGVPRDRARAIALYRRACSGGDTPSCADATRLQNGR